MKICYIASSGGHLAQMKKLIEGLKDEEGWQGFLVTEKLAKKTDCSLPVYYLKQVNRKEWKFPFLMIENTFISLNILIKEKPNVIISTGTLCTIPMMLLGKITGRKIIYIESFAKTKTATITGKFAYRFADRFMVQWPSMLKVYPKAVYKGGLY